MTPADVQVHHDGYPTHRRKVRFDWSATPLHWVPDDPFSTHMMNVLHLLLPAGERWFIRVVDEAAPMVDDPDLKAAIKPFIQQEAWHAWAHQMVLDHLAEQGIDTKPYTEKLEKIAVHTWQSTLRLAANTERWWLHRRLADVAALEHFTAVLGQWVIQNRADWIMRAPTRSCWTCRGGTVPRRSNTDPWCTTSIRTCVATTLCARCRCL